MRSKSVLLGLVLLCGWTGIATAESHTLTIGTLGDDPAKLIRTYQPLATYLQTQLASHGYVDSKVAITSDARDMGHLMQNGKVDVFIDSPMPTIAVNYVGGGKMILRRWKGGVGEYQSVIFTRTQSDVTSVKSLRGKIVAFEQPFSSTGYVLPRLLIERDGESLSVSQVPGMTTVPGKISYVFSGDDENTMEWVLRGQVDAGAMSHNNVEKLAKGSISRLKEIWRSPPIPRHVVSVRGNLPPADVETIVGALTSLDKTPEGRQILNAFEKTTKFDAIPADSLSLFTKEQDGVLRLLNIEK